MCVFTLQVTIVESQLHALQSPWKEAVADGKKYYYHAEVSHYIATTTTTTTTRIINCLLIIDRRNNVGKTG
jgi:hypothetical protein